MNIRVVGCRCSSTILILFLASKQKLDPSIYQLGTRVWKSKPIFIPELENLYLFLYLMAEIATHPYTKWQKSRLIPVLELKNCDPSERHLRTRYILGVNPQGPRRPYISLYSIRPWKIFAKYQPLMCEAFGLQKTRVLLSSFCTPDHWTSGFVYLTFWCLWLKSCLGSWQKNRSNDFFLSCKNSSSGIPKKVCQMAAQANEHLSYFFKARKLRGYNPLQTVSCFPLGIDNIDS